MTDQTSTSAFDAVESDGFVDYYRLLDLPADSSPEDLQTRIGTLYNEAQANRDHRNMSKRQQYQLMLELLPQARTILTNETRRAQYDEYTVRHRAGETTGDHEEFLKQLSAADDTATTDDSTILGVQEKAEPARTPLREPRATTKTVPSERVAVSRTPADDAAFAKIGSSIRGSFLSALVFFVFFVIFHLFIFNQDSLLISILIAATAGIITWWLTHYRTRNKTSV